MEDSGLNADMYWGHVSMGSLRAEGKFLRSWKIPGRILYVIYVREAKPQEQIARY